MERLVHVPILLEALLGAKQSVLCGNPDAFAGWAHHIALLATSYTRTICHRSQLLLLEGFLPR